MRNIIGGFFFLPVFVAVLGFSAALALFKGEIFGFSWDMARAICLGGEEHEST
jgi:hypothetical protein